MYVVSTSTEIGLPCDFKVLFYNHRLEIITDTDHEVKRSIIMDLLAQTIITLQILILNQIKIDGMVNDHSSSCNS